jgi:hypothetical protein|eukprot:TRINITY_DN49499_c0_g1_i1.p1 TRINITY_DN49499_c0_g1~~TRINITY_DN49499_c0_g1_i1.p1  ORF type:complete len:339 (+),score=58.34 TRINITY_DN49499_c0_g1_i1:97-1017(+)
MTANRRHKRRKGPLLLLLSTVLGAFVCHVAFECFVANYSHFRAKAARKPDVITTRAALGDFNIKELEDLLKSPEKMRKMQKEAQQMMANPQTARMMQTVSEQMQATLSKLGKDPELTDFFADIKANGLDAMKKYDGDERILRKLSQATGETPSPLETLDSHRGTTSSFNAGDTVHICGLSKAPELNGQKAMVIPPTRDEQRTLEGTDRLIVRLLDSGDQFAVRLQNLKSSIENRSNEAGNKPVHSDVLQTTAAKRHENGGLDDIKRDPELGPVLDDIRKNGMTALDDYLKDEAFMAKINTVLGAGR